MIDRQLWWRAARVLAMIGVTVAVVLSVRAVNWPRTLEALRAAHGAWLLAAVAWNAVILVLWAQFWRVLRPQGEPPVSHRRMLEIVATTSALMNTLPFGGGQASALVLLVRRAAMTKRGALSLMALDQLGEGLVKIGLFLLVALLVPLPTWMRVGVATACAGVAVWFVIVMIASRWAAELGIVRDVNRALGALACVAGMKGVQLVAIIAVQHAFGLDLPASGSLLVLATIVLASMVTVSPGNLGAFEAAVFLAYRYLEQPPELALSLAIMQHVCFMLPSVGIGYVIFSVQTLSRRAIASP